MVLQNTQEFNIIFAIYFCELLLLYGHDW